MRDNYAFSRMIFLQLVPSAATPFCLVKHSVEPEINTSSVNDLYIIMIYSSKTKENAMIVSHDSNKAQMNFDSYILAEIEQ